MIMNARTVDTLRAQAGRVAETHPDLDTSGRLRQDLQLQAADQVAEDEVTLLLRIDQLAEISRSQILIVR